MQLTKEQNKELIEKYHFLNLKAGGRVKFVMTMTTIERNWIICQMGGVLHLVRKCAPS